MFISDGPAPLHCVPAAANSGFCNPAYRVLLRCCSAATSGALIVLRDEALMTGQSIEVFLTQPVAVYAAAQHCKAQHPDMHFA